MLSRNPLAPVVDYQSMLNRIFWFTTASALAAVWMLRRNFPELERLLAQVDFTIEFGGEKAFPIPGGYLGPALAVGILTRVYRLHARISDWLGVRECFDVDVVIGEFVTQLAIDLPPYEVQQLSEKRHAIMRTGFYPYVSGREPQIDPSLIHQALDAWSWFWIDVEVTFVFVIASFALIAGGVVTGGLQTLVTTLVLAAIGLPTTRNQCRRYAVAQVRAILADPTREAAVRAAIVGSAAEPFAVRLAA